MNESIVNEINEQHSEDGTQEQKKLTTWLVCMIASKKYAIRSADVLEIIRDVAVYKLPFMPLYIEGVINRRGDPFTVINPLAVFESSETKPPEEPLFLVLKRNDDQISIHISDILFFTDVDESDMNLIPNNNDDKFFLGSIEYGKDEIPAINPAAFEILIRKDLGSA